MSKKLKLTWFSEQWYVCWDKLTLLTNMTRYPIIFGSFDKVLESITSFKTRNAVFHISWEENKSQKLSEIFLKKCKIEQKRASQWGSRIKLPRSSEKSQELKRTKVRFVELVI